MRSNLLNFVAFETQHLVSCRSSWECVGCA